MSVIEKLKSESLALRKAKNPLAASITFALSEIEKVGKNAGNRATTEDEAIKAVQKIISSIETTLQNLFDSNIDLSMDPAKLESMNTEKSILESVLPKMVSEDTVREYLQVLGSAPDFDLSDKSAKGTLMKAIKAKFGVLVDMKRVGVMIQEHYGV